MGGLLTVAAFRNPFAGDQSTDPSTCQQTYEFGNTGCFEVQGQVVAASGLPLGDISVAPRPVPGRALFNGDYSTTDVTGQFRVRLSRMIGERLSNGALDTLSVYVVAADPRSAGVGIPARVRDGVLTVVTVAPIGTRPTPTVVRIGLQVP